MNRKQYSRVSNHGNERSRSPDSMGYVLITIICLESSFFFQDQCKSNKSEICDENATGLMI